MKRKIIVALITLLLCHVGYAQEDDDQSEGSSNITQSVIEYNWETCMDAKATRCINDCATSEDRDCKENCNTVAADTCKAEGLAPPAQ